MQRMILFMMMAAPFALYDAVSSACPLYIAPTKIKGGGRGVFAGKKYSAEEVVENSVTITILYEHTSKTSLANYVFGCGYEDYSMVTFGIGSMFNCVPALVSVANTWAEPYVNHPMPQMEHSSNFTMTYFEATRNIGIGEEIFVSYGDNWFEERQSMGASYENTSDIVPYTRDELEQYGVCVGDVMVATSSVEDAGLGLHAYRSFRKGELVLVSPVAVLPWNIVEASRSSSLLMNYVMTEEGSAVAIFPFTNAALINHAASPSNQTGEGDGDNVYQVNFNDSSFDHPPEANLHYDWFDWNLHGPQIEGEREQLMQSLADVLELSYDDVIALSSAPLDLAYYASRDIALGEEFFIDYGSAWTSAFDMWNRARKDLESTGNVAGNDNLAPFRHPVGLRSGLLPIHWFYEDTQNADENNVVSRGNSEL